MEDGRCWVLIASSRFAQAWREIGLFASNLFNNKARNVQNLPDKELDGLTPNSEDHEHITIFRRGSSQVI